MSVHKVVIITVKDADGYAAFAKVASAVLARHGGEIVAQNEADASDRILVQRFADGAGARAFYADPELQEALAAGEGSFTRDVVIIERDQ